MMSELRQALAETEAVEQKAKAYDTIVTIANNAITFMYEQGMMTEEIAEYLCCSVDTLKAIDEEDYETIAKEES